MKRPKFQGKSSEHLCHWGLGLKETRMGTCTVHRAPPPPPHASSQHPLGNTSSVPTSSHPCKADLSPGPPRLGSLGAAELGGSPSPSPFPTDLAPRGSTRPKASAPKAQGRRRSTCAGLHHTLPCNMSSTGAKPQPRADPTQRGTKGEASGCLRPREPHLSSARAAGSTGSYLGYLRQVRSYLLCNTS